MIGKVKKWLGIEGVKLELELPEEVSGKLGLLPGKILFQSMNPQTVKSIRIVLIEKYSRGRGKEKLIDEYELGEIQLSETFIVEPGEVKEVDFSLPFKMVKSDVDEFGDRNFLFGGMAKAAKLIQAAKSEYRVEAEAQVQGVALNPFDKKYVLIK
ncbi:MAG: hypothetical protein DHS20C18_16800 [Saprospiraceae bacterium]|nr:MAG: hypothetical protein DHS20C18_16800 [Saprospiraceae bacterium]